MEDAATAFFLIGGLAMLGGTGLLQEVPRELECLRPQGEPVEKVTDMPPTRISTPHTGSPDFGAHCFPDLPKGWVWVLDTKSWEEDGIWWDAVKKHHGESE